MPGRWVAIVSISRSSSWVCDADGGQVAVTHRTATSPTAATTASGASCHGISVESLLDGPDGELDPIAQADPVQDPRDVGGNGGFTTTQPRGDLDVRQPLAQQDDHRDIVI